MGYLRASLKNYDAWKTATRQIFNFEEIWPHDSYTCYASLATSPAMDSKHCWWFIYNLKARQIVASNKLSSNQKAREVPRGPISHVSCTLKNTNPTILSSVNSVWTSGSESLASGNKVMQSKLPSGYKIPILSPNLSAFQCNGFDNKMK